FLPTQIVSSDECRALVFDDPSDQGVSGHAFDLMHFIIEKRLTLGRLTVADATNLRRQHRRALARIAQAHYFNTAAVVLNMQMEMSLERKAKVKRKVRQEALMNQCVLLKRPLTTIEEEDFNYVHVLDKDSQSGATVRIGRSVSRRAG